MKIYNYITEDNRVTATSGHSKEGSQIYRVMR